MPDGLNLLVLVSKFGIDTTKNPWYRIGIVSILKSWYRPYLIFYQILFQVKIQFAILAAIGLANFLFSW